MKGFEKVWFWFGLLICPLVVIAAVFILGRSAGQVISNNTAELSSIELVTMLAAIICCGFEFVRSFKKAKILFNKKSL